MSVIPKRSGDLCVRYDIELHQWPIPWIGVCFLKHFFLFLRNIIPKQLFLSWTDLSFMYSYLKLHVKRCPTLLGTNVLRLAFWLLSMNGRSVYPICLLIEASLHRAWLWHSQHELNWSSNAFCDYKYPDIGIFRSNLMIISKFNASIT